MNKKGGGKSLLFVTFLFLIFAMIGVARSVDVFAVVGTGQGFTPGGGCNYKTVKDKNGNLTIEYIPTGWNIDTCYGLSWLYYKWPEENGAPINKDIEFFCTDRTCPITKAGYTNKVSKECASFGGFWYIGFEVYGDNGKHYLHSFGFNMGSPYAGSLVDWLRTDGIGEFGEFRAGLYPITIFGTQFVNEDFEEYAHDFNGYIDYISATEIADKGYAPGKCSEYYPNNPGVCVNGLIRIGSAGKKGGFPRIVNKSGNYQAVEAASYGTTKEVYNDWLKLRPEERITSTNVSLSETDFKKVNWFCSGRNGNLAGRSGVKTDQSNEIKYSSWTDKEDPAEVDYGSTITVADSIEITFYHQIQGAGQVNAEIVNNQTNLKGADRNGKKWDDKTWKYENDDDGENNAKTLTRTRTVTRAELEAISSETTKVCDTMTFGAQSSTACVKLKPTSPIDEVKSKSAVKIPKGATPPSERISEATKTSPNGETKIADYDITVIGSPASVTIQFDHNISAWSTSGSGTANVGYTITQTVTNKETETVTTYDTNTGTSAINVNAANRWATVTADSPPITVSGITASTNIMVCQEMTATYGTALKTKVCAHIKGNDLPVTGRSAVGTDSEHEEVTTNWVNGSEKKDTSRTIYAPYNDNATTKAYFKHEVKAANSVNISDGTGVINYSIKRGDSYISQNQTYNFSTNFGEHTVYGQLIDVSLGITCQTLEFSYSSYSGAPEVCINIKPARPNFKGSSKVTGNGNSETVTTSGDEATLATIKVKVAAGGTTKQRIDFKHVITATSSRLDARGKATGVMPYTIVKNYTDDKNGNFSGTFPSSGSSTYDETYTSYTMVEVAPGQTETVCETLTFANWTSKVCARVTGELSLPSVESQTTAKHKNTSRSSGWATKTSPNKTAESFEILVPMLPSVSANGGIDMPVTFIHDVKATITNELDAQNTGNVSYTITTSGATDNAVENNKSFRIEVKDSAIGNERIKVETITRDKVANVRIGQTTTVCQTLSFTYDGVARSTTACANFRGISADPKGASKVTVNGCGGGASVSTGYEADGAIVWLDVYGCSKDSIKGSDIVFDHGFSIGGEMSVGLPYSISNSCTDSNSCNENYSKIYNSSSNRPLYQYKGHSGTARTVVWLYRRILSDGTITNTYERSPAITDEDAKNMYNIGAACETLSFEYDDTWHNTTACVRFKNYNPCPELGSIGTTASTSYVKKYLGSSATSPTPDQISVVYAKPTDNIEFMHCYYPGAQATRYTNDIESNYANSSNNGKYVNIPLRNAFVEQQNQFSIGNKTGTDSFVGNSNSYTYTQGGQIMVHPEKTSNFIGIVGNPASTSVTSSRTAITTNAVGHEIEQSLLDHPGTNSVAGHDRGNCGSGCVVYYQNADDNKWYDITKRNSDNAISESSSAKVIVPYNYRTTASIDANSEYVYAGEGISGQNVKIRVNQRYNAKADDTYATKTAESTVKLYMFYTTNTNPNEGGDHQRAGNNLNACTYYGNSLGFSNCAELPAKDGATTSGLVFNANSDINPNPDKPESVSAFMSDYNVPDLPAGSKVCMGVTVYPAESTDTEPSNGNTFVSKAYCRTVAKKPSFQVWGGSVYASGNIAANLATKYTINGIYDYSMVRANGAPSITFGSWAEQAIMANGVVTGLASGAATGYGKVGLVVNTEYPGGSKSSKYCDMSRLSLANTFCQNNKTGTFGISGESATKTTLKEKYASKAKVKDASRNDDKYTYVSLNLSNAGSYTEEDGVRYTFAESNLAIEATSRLSAGTMHVVYAKGNIVIRGSSLLYNDGTLQNLNDVPQYIIIADGNIYIEPSVTRVDAVLLAEKTINTCAKLSGNSITEASKAGNNLITDLYCNKQLKINGTLIADALKLYRIFGASTGLNSVVPAEIINYSPSLYLWEGSRVEEKHTRSLYTTYLHELAPRQ